jgi:hypothetical protein
MTTPTAPAASVGRPVLTFPTGGHRCRTYTLVCGFYECAHGHVKRIAPSRRGGCAVSADLDGLRASGRNALRRVAHGQIVSDNGVLRHRSDVLPPDVITTLEVLHRHGFIALVPGATESDRPSAQLTMTGTQLLDLWNRQPAGDTPVLTSATTPARADTATDAVPPGRSS